MDSDTNIAIEAATDGACSGNPGKGGWGGLIIFIDGSEIEIGGAEKMTTNNRMELTAAIKTLEKLKNFKLKENFKLRTDSKYLIEGYSSWINNWKKNGWKTSSGKPVQNMDLWKEIDSLRIAGLQMEFVKGHNGDKNNERVDLIATNYSKGISLEKDNLRLDFKDENQLNLASEDICNLYHQIELVNKFAQKGYLLKSNELCELLSIKTNVHLENHEKFNWRNWVIEPTINNHWVIKKNLNNITN